MADRPFRSIALDGLLLAIVLFALVGGYHLAFADTTASDPDIDMDTDPAPDSDGMNDSDAETDLDGPREPSDEPTKPGAMVYFDNLLSSSGITVNFVDVSSTTEPCPDINLEHETATTTQDGVRQDSETVALAYADLTDESPDQEYTNGDLNVSVVDPTGQIIATYEIDNDTAEQYLDNEISREEYFESVGDSIEYQF